MLVSEAVISSVFFSCIASLFCSLKRRDRYKISTSSTSSLITAVAKFKMSAINQMATPVTTLIQNTA